MESQKLKFLNDVEAIVDDLYRVIFDINNKKQLENVFGMSHEQMISSLKRVVNALPENIFKKLSKGQLEEIENICAREFIFFQAQEGRKDPHYQRDLANFITIFSRDITRRLKAKRSPDEEVRND